jgi:hypothetical protein
LLRGVKRHRHHAAGSSSWAAYFQTNNEDFNFWSEEWALTKTQLVRLALLNGQDPIKRTGNANKSPEAEAEEKLRNANSTVKLSMLKSSVEYSQACLKRQNTQEEKSLKRYAEQEAGHKKRQADIDARYHNKTLIAEFFQSNTNEESRQWGSWQRQRQRQRAQFESSTKIQQGALAHAKLLIGAYEAAAMPSSKQMMESQQAMKNFCHEAWTEMKKQQDQNENALPAVQV